MLSTKETAGQRLVLDCRSVPLPILDAHSDVANSERYTDAGRPPLIEFKLRPRYHWNGATVEFVLGTLQVEKPWLLIIPDWLPTIRQAEGVSVAAPLPKIEVDTDLSPELVGYLRDSAPAASPALLQGVLSTAPFHRVQAGAAVPFSFAASVSEAAPPDIERFAVLLSQSYEFCRHVFGTDPDTKLAVVGWNDMSPADLIPYGSCLPVTPEEIGFAQRKGGAPDFAVTQRMAGIWWPGGCRLAGQFSSEVAGMIRGTLGLLWLRQVGREDTFQRNFRHIQRISRYSALSDRWDAARGLVRRGHTARGVLALFERVERNPARLRAVTQHCWGRVTSSKEVLAELLEEDR